MAQELNVGDFLQARDYILNRKRFRLLMWSRNANAFIILYYRKGEASYQSSLTLAEMQEARLVPSP